jgi:Fe-S-cluster containining protein
MHDLMVDDLWYKNGLRFACLRCGGCCSGFSGTVLVSAEEMATLAQRLDLSEAEFRKRCTRVVGREATSLIEKKNKDCIFFDAAVGCTMYADRPRQCRTWPFWRSNVHSAERWKREAARCPGMNQGELHSRERIKQLSEDDGSSGMLS